MYHLANLVGDKNVFFTLKQKTYKEDKHEIISSHETFRDAEIARQVYSVMKSSNLRSEDDISSELQKEKIALKIRIKEINQLLYKIKGEKK